jgi:hypothetical protein
VASPGQLGRNAHPGGEIGWCGSLSERWAWHTHRAQQEEEGDCEEIGQCSCPRGVLAPVVLDNAPDGAGRADCGLGAGSLHL